MNTHPVVGEALTTTLDDEYRARATYRAVLDKFGSVPPFANIVEAEERHINKLLPLFPRYGITPPADRWSGQVTLPNSLVECCQAGVDAEISNYSMYDGYLAWLQEPDIRAAFINLRNASEFNHLPAFQRCVERASRTGSAPGFNPSGRSDGSALQIRGNTSQWILGGVLAGAALIYFMRRKAA